MFHIKPNVYWKKLAFLSLHSRERIFDHSSYSYDIFVVNVSNWILSPFWDFKGQFYQQGSVAMGIAQVLCH